MKALYTLILVLFAGTAYGQSKLLPCAGQDKTLWGSCFGTFIYSANNQLKGSKYVGEFNGASFDGQGTLFRVDGSIGLGEWKSDKPHGKFIEYRADGTIERSGIFVNGKLKQPQYIDPNSFTSISRNTTAPEVSESPRQTISSAAATCELPYQLTDSLKKIHCLDKFPISKKISQIHNKPLIDLAKNSKCWSLAIPTEGSCNLIGFSSAWPTHCGMSLGIDIRNKEALDSCQSTGCKCSLVISSNDIVDDQLFFSNAMPESDLVVKDNTVKETGPEIKKNFESENKQLLKPSCVGNDARRWTNCQGVINFTNGDRYEGEFRDGKWDGWGTYYHLANNQFRGDKYSGQFLNGSRQGSGRYTSANGGETFEGIWNVGTFVRVEKINLQAPTDFALLEERKRIEEEKMRLAEERRQMEEEHKRRQIAKANTKIDLRISTTKPDTNGIVVINVQTGTDTLSLKINGEEQGSNEQGLYQIKRLPKLGLDTAYSIVASDVYGNTQSASITLSARAITSTEIFDRLSPEKMKVSQSRDAVAIIIGIQDYKRLPKAEFASDDARAFYDYAVRALGVKPQNIKMLLDAEAEQAEIYRTFKSWLPAFVKKDKTDIYVFYSGHGLPSTDGKSLYLLPQGVDKEFLAETGVDQSKIIAALNDSKPRSVTIFIDSCYSGSTRTGETLLASARPIVLKAEEYTFPINFTVISASSFDQISSSSPELKHGIFSFYLMKGLEGEASEKKDGKITVRELQNYLAEMVSRQAMRLNRKQQPQMIGDPDRVLVNK